MGFVRVACIVGFQITKRLPTLKYQTYAETDRIGAQTVTRHAPQPLPSLVRHSVSLLCYARWPGMHQYIDEY